MILISGKLLWGKIFNLIYAVEYHLNHPRWFEGLKILEVRLVKAKCLTGIFFIPHIFNYFHNVSHPLKLIKLQTSFLQHAAYILSRLEIGVFPRVNKREMGKILNESSRVRIWFHIWLGEEWLSKTTNLLHNYSTAGKYCVVCKTWLSQPCYFLIKNPFRAAFTSYTFINNFS